MRNIVIIIRRRRFERFNDETSADIVKSNFFIPEYRASPPLFWEIRGDFDVSSKVVMGISVARLTRGGRGTRMGGGPRWRRCCTGGGMFCCGRRRWWVRRVSTNLACLLQHLVYGVHVCPHGIKRHSNAKARRQMHARIPRGFRALNHIRSHRSVFFFLLFFGGLGSLINDKIRNDTDGREQVTFDQTA